MNPDDDGSSCARCGEPFDDHDDVMACAYSLRELSVEILGLDDPGPGPDLPKEVSG